MRNRRVAVILIMDSCTGLYARKDWLPVQGKKYRGCRVMKKYRLLMLFLLATITIGLFVIVPAVREAGAAGAPQLVSKTPADGTVILDVWDGVVTITYDTPVRFGSGCIRLYYRIKNNDYVNWCEQVGGEDSAKYFSISADGTTVTIDFGWNFNDLFGDPYNTYNENYKVRYWVQVDGGAIVSRDDPPVDAAYWGDRNWNIYAGDAARGRIKLPGIRSNESHRSGGDGVLGHL